MLSPADAVRLSGGIAVSRNDRRHFEALTLPNGLRVVLVSDPDADTAAAALSVGVGSHHDPLSIPGLAHFVEHMLFLGTELFPDENSFSSFLNAHGGQSNAYTATDQTNYHMEVATHALAGALDRFAAFFTCPLFTESATARELNAVDAEHGKNLQSDMWRDYQLDKSTSRPGHPAAKFGTGDSRTLRDAPAAAGIDVRAAMLAFHAEHYTASRMALVVVSSAPLAELRALVVPRFEGVPTNGSSAPVEVGHPWGGAPPPADGEPLAGVQQWVVPVRDTRTLTLSWAAPPLRAGWEAKPERYLTHLLGHEGPGSVLACLKARGLATELSAGSDGEAGYSTIYVTVGLTPEGLEASDEVAAVVYAYIGMLRAAGPQRWVHDELAGQAAVAFRFRSTPKPLGGATRLAHALQELPTEHAVAGSHLVTRWDPAAVGGLLELLTPGNSRLRVSAQALGARCDRVEPWYGVRYGQAPFTPAQVARWEAAAAGYAAVAAERVGCGRDVDGEVAGVDAWAASLAPALHLPAPNEFLASDFALKHPRLAAAAAAEGGEAPAVAAESAAAEGGGEGGTTPCPPRALREPEPTLLLRSPTRAVWHHADDHFAVPKAYLHAEVTLPAGYVSPRAIVLSDLAVRLLKESLVEISYAAELAGLEYTVTPSVRGLSIAVGGFSHKLPVLAARLGERLAGLAGAFTDLQFAMHLDRATRELANWDVSQPYSLAAYDASVATTTPKWHIDERKAALAAAPATPGELRAFLRGPLLASAHVTALVSGNASPDDALALVEALFGPVAAAGGGAPPTPAQLAGPRVVSLPPPVPLARGGALAWEFAHAQRPRNPADPNAAMDLLLQVGPQAAGADCAQNALLDLAVHVASEPYFDALRTKQALGYIVFATHKQEAGVEWARFLVQSNKVPAEELVERTEAFLHAFAGTLAAMPADRFAANVEAVVVKKLEADRNAQEEAARLWGEIRDGSLDFRRASHEVAALRALTQEAFAAWFAAHVAPGGRRRRFFASLVGAGAPQAGAAGGESAAEEGGEEGAAVEGDAGLPADGGDGTPHPGEAAPTTDGGLAREDALAGGAPTAGAPAPSPSAAADAAAARRARTLHLTAAQAAAVMHAVATAEGHVTFPSAEGDAVLRRAFAAAGVDVGPALEAAAAAAAACGGSSGGGATPAVHVRVQLDAVGTLRALLPLYPDVGALRGAAYRAA